MKRKFSLFISLLLILFTLSGCFFMFDEPAADFGSDYPWETLPQEPSVNDPKDNAAQDIPATPDTPATPSEPTVPDRPVKPSEPTVTVISDINSLRDFLCSNKEKDNLTTTFDYKGGTKLSATLLAQITSAFYIDTSWKGTVYTVTVTEYPGDRVVDAYFSGNRSALSAEENLVLDKAVYIVNQAKAAAADDYALEKYLFDYIAKNVLYYSPYTNVPDKNDPPRHLTAVGALLDGKANCQGYSDAFYTLASIAGFKVGRMNVDDGKTGHVVNTILLGGKWYVVDATYGDVESDKDSKISYRLFNAGKDMCDEYNWKEEMEYFPIAETSDGMFYYSRGENRSFSDINNLADHIVNSWKNGSTEFDAVLLGKVVEWSDLSQLLSARLQKQGNPWSYYIWSNKTSDNTFFRVEFSS